LLGLCTASLVQATVIIVPDDNLSVRDAVASAGPGDVVQVRPGTYAEGVRIDKGQTGLVIEGLGGVPVIAPEHGDDAFRVKRVDGVTIRGFSISSSHRGLRLDDASGATLEDLDISGGTSDGIRIKGGSANTVQSFSVFHPNGRGVRVDKSPGAVIRDGSVVNSRREGILVKTSDNVSVLVNIVGGNFGGGVRLIKCPNATIDQTTAGGNGGSGIRVQTSAGLTITNNTAIGNVQYGIRIQSSPPVSSVADLTGAGNSGENLRVD
jgi:parallel beta-helix repeat protein